MISADEWTTSSVYPKRDPVADSQVEVRISQFTGQVMVRHSADGGWAISVPVDTWRKFIAGVKLGDFDL